MGTNCSTEFEDGTTCDCGFCNGGAGMEGTDGAGAGISSLGAGVTQTHRSLGFDLRCSNNMVSLECTRVDSGAVEFVATAGVNGGIGSPAHPVVSLRGWPSPSRMRLSPEGHT